MKREVIEVRVKPNSRHSHLEPQADGTWLAHLKSLPVDGKANAELIALIASHWHCSKSSVAIKTGASGRIKRVTITTTDA